MVNIFNRIAKKLARRKRIKGTRRAWKFGERMNAAQMLIANNWGVTFGNPPAARAGTKRRIARERAAA